MSASNGNFLIEADKIFSFIPNLIQETICGRKVPILAPDTKFKPMFGSEAVWSMPPPWSEMDWVGGQLRKQNNHFFTPYLHQVLYEGVPLE